MIVSRMILLGTWPAIQACALTGNRTGDLSVHRLALKPLSHTTQGGTKVVMHMAATVMVACPWGDSVQMALKAAPPCPSSSASLQQPLTFVPHSPPTPFPTPTPTLLPPAAPAKPCLASEFSGVLESCFLNHIPQQKCSVVR